MTNVQVTIELGHRGTPRAKPTKEGFTHDWTVYVRCPEQYNMSHFVEKVVFRLHESFKNPIRVCKEAPYQVSEHGYAGFELPIEIFFKSKAEPKKLLYHYNLFLHMSDPVNFSRCEKITFNNPTEEFKKKMLKAGGVLMIPTEEATFSNLFGPPINTSESPKKPHKQIPPSTKDKPPRLSLDDSKSHMTPGSASTSSSSSSGSGKSKDKGSNSSRSTSSLKSDSSSKEKDDGHVKEKSSSKEKASSKDSSSSLSGSTSSLSKKHVDSPGMMASKRPPESPNRHHDASLSKKLKRTSSSSSVTEKRSKERDKEKEADREKHRLKEAERERLKAEREKEREREQKERARVREEEREKEQKEREKERARIKEEEQKERARIREEEREKEQKEREKERARVKEEEREKERKKLADEKEARQKEREREKERQRKERKKESNAKSENAKTEKHSKSSKKHSSGGGERDNHRSKDSMERLSSGESKKQRSPYVEVKKEKEKSPPEELKEIKKKYDRDRTKDKESSYKKAESPTETANAKKDGRRKSDVSSVTSGNSDKFPPQKVAKSAGKEKKAEKHSVKEGKLHKGKVLTKHVEQQRDTSVEKIKSPKARKMSSESSRKHSAQKHRRKILKQITSQELIRDLSLSDDSSDSSSVSSLSSSSVSSIAAASPSRVSRSPSRGTRSPSHGTRSPMRGTRSPSQGNRSPSQGTRSLSQGARSPSQGTRSPLRGTRSPSRGSRSGSRGSRSGSRGSRSGSRGSRSGSHGSRSGSRGSRSGSRGSRSGSRGSRSASESETEVEGEPSPSGPPRPVSSVESSPVKSALGTLFAELEQEESEDEIVEPSSVFSSHSVGSRSSPANRTLSPQDGKTLPKGGKPSSRSKKQLKKTDANGCATHLEHVAGGKHGDVTLVHSESKGFDIDRTRIGDTGSGRSSVNIGDEAPVSMLESPNGEDLTELVSLQRKLMAITDPTVLVDVVMLIQKVGKFKVGDSSFDFDLCSLDRSTVQQIRTFLNRV